MVEEKSTNMKVSVIIPTYKPRDYLWVCLDSLCSQTMPKADFEVLLILNGCCEPYNSQIKQYISQRKEVQWNYIQTEKAGVSNARNIGLDNARGEYISFIDDDDYVSGTYLELLYSKADSETVSICCPYCFKDGSTDEISYGITDVFKRIDGYDKIQPVTARRYFNGPCMKLIHRGIIEERRYDQRISNGEDGLFMFLISDKIKHFCKVPEEAVYYRRVHNTSLTHKKRSRWSKMRNSALIIWEEVKAVLSHPFDYNWYMFLRSVMGLSKVGLIG